MSSGAFIRRPAVLLVLGLCLIGAAVNLLGRLANGPHLDPKRETISSAAGVEAYPAFSADGKRLAYSGRGISKDDTLHVFVRPVPAGEPRQLTTGDANDVGPVWSRDDANIAFLRVDSGHARCIVIPSSGGAERQVAEFAVADTDRPLPPLAWARDGRSLAVAAKPGEKEAQAIFVLPLDSGRLRKITTPAEGSEGDSSPAVSPDGATIAFVRAGTSEGADIYTTDWNGGAPRRLTFDDRPILGLAWMPGGRELIYSGNRTGGWQLWRLSGNGGSPRELLIGGKGANYPAVAFAGNELAYTESPWVTSIWRAALGTEGSGERALLRSQGRESAPSYSPDGKSIANISDQSGFEEVWLSDADGNNRVQVTNLKGWGLSQPRWSPDGKLLLFQVRTERGEEVYTVTPAANGKLAHVMIGVGGASWSRDGKSIYFESRGLIWKAAADGGNPEPITKRPRAQIPEASFDGAYIYYRLRRSIWRVPVKGGEEEEAIIPDHDLTWGTLQAVKNGLYYLEWNRPERSQVVSFFDFAQKRNSVAFKMKGGDLSQGSSYSVSPDGKNIIYAKVDAARTNLVLVENFK